MNNKETRLKRARKVRSSIKSSGRVRLSVHRTPRHIYAQIIDTSGSVVLASASTVQVEIKSSVKNTGNVDAAAAVGAAIAQKAVAAGVNEVAFDRSGFKYHGRVKALADAGQENGLSF